jgi:glycosyltransferase involved in cell wall biosynthesis
MRVLHFYKTSLLDTVGGIEKVIDQICKGTVKLGLEVEVLSLTSHQVPKTVEFNGYCVHREKLNFQIASTGFSASAFLRFAQLAKKADIIHYHFPWPFMDVVHFATRHKKPTVVTYHSDIIRQKHLLKLYRPLKWKFLNDVSRIVATSPNYLVSSEVLAKYKHNVDVIPIGLDKSTYPVPSSERLTYWRERIGQKFFLFIGVLRYYKGLHILLEAAQGTDYPIVIVGAGPVENELKLRATQLGLRNIHFLGRLPDEDKVALLMLCYSILFPSHLRSEAFGISLLEGAMYGKPMISSEIGTGTTFINIADETGLVVQPRDPIAMRQAIRHLWEHPEQAAEMGRRAEKRYHQHFTADQMAGEYVKLYREFTDR